MRTMPVVLIVGMFLVLAACQSGLSETEVERLIQQRVDEAKAQLADANRDSGIDAISSMDGETIITGDLVVEGIIVARDVSALESVSVINPRSQAGILLSSNEGTVSLLITSESGDNAVWINGDGEHRLVLSDANGEDSVSFSTHPDISSFTIRGPVLISDPDSERRILLVPSLGTISVNAQDQNRVLLGIDPSGQGFLRLLDSREVPVYAAP